LSSDASFFARAPAARRVFFFFACVRRYPTRRRARLFAHTSRSSRFPGRSRARMGRASFSFAFGRTREARERLAAQTRAFKPAFEFAFGQTSKARYASPSRRLIGLLGGLVDERLVDVGDHTTTGDGRLDQGVELLVTADGELEVAGRDALDLWVFGSSGRRRRSERVVVAVFRARKKRTEKRFSNGFKTRPGGLSTGRVRDPERKRAGKRRGRAARAAMSTGRTLRSLEALPASSRTSAVRYSAVRESGRER